MEFLIAIMTSDSNILAQVLYQDQSTVELTAEVICSNKKCRGEKCAYLTKKSTRAPTNVSNAKLAVTCTIFLLRIKNHVLPYLVGPIGLKKRQSWITKKRNSRL